jgi:hypothetical protein
LTTATSETDALPSQRIEPVVGGLAAGFLLCIATAAIKLETLTGLPAHPLLLHVPVVLTPILSAAAIALMVRTEWRHRYGLALALLALIAMASTILAAGAGEAFRASRPIFASAALDEHAELGDQLKVVTVVFAAAIVGIVSVDLLHGPGLLGRLADFVRQPRVELLVRIGIAVLAIVALIWVVRTGHAGAKVAWSQPSPLTHPGR